MRDQHRALLDIAIRALVERDRSVALDRLLDELGSPSPNTLLALEFLATARRIDELEEVVLVDVREWLADWRAGPRSRDLRRRAQVIFTLATVWGVVLHEIPSRRGLDWSYVTKSLRWSFAQPYAEPSQPLVPDRVGPVLADTGDVGQNALIDSVASIVARVGFERASATRIARRAGPHRRIDLRALPHEGRPAPARVEILLARRFSDDLAANSYTFTAADPGSATASVVGGYLSAPRREWRRFRIEAQLAARHRRELARTLDRIQEAAIGEYLDVLGAKTAEERRSARHHRPVRPGDPARPRVRRPGRARNPRHRLEARPPATALTAHPGIAGLRNARHNGPARWQNGLVAHPTRGGIDDACPCATPSVPALPSVGAHASLISSLISPNRRRVRRPSAGLRNCTEGARVASHSRLGDHR